MNGLWGTKKEKWSIGDESDGGHYWFPLRGARGGKNANSAWQELGPQIQELNHCPTHGLGWVRGGSWSVLTFASHSSISCVSSIGRSIRENKERACLLLHPTELSLLVYKAGMRMGLQGMMENTTLSNHPTRLCPSFHLVGSPPFHVFITLRNCSIYLLLISSIPHLQHNVISIEKRPSCSPPYSQSLAHCRCSINERKWKSFSCVWFFRTPWTIQSMEFSRPEY